MANTSNGKKSGGSKKPSSGNARYKTTSGGNRTSSSRGGAKKAALNPRSIIILAIVVLVVIALLVVSYKLGWIDLSKINDSFTQQSNGTSTNNNGGGNGGNTVTDLAGTNIDGDYLAVHFIDIGQGDAIVMMLPDGKIFVLDAGSTSTGLATIRAGYLSYLSDTLHVDEVDYLLISHPDTDHYNMAGNVLDTYVVHNVLSQ